MAVKEFLIFVGVILFALWQTGAFHVIQSGHIGVYKRGGALLDTWTQPGLHFLIPFITQFYQVQVTLQTDQVRDIPCGTSSGVILNFDKVEVVNRLKKDLALETIKNYTIKYDQTWIFSKIHHEINQFCSSHSLQDVLIQKFNILDESLKASLQAGCDEWAPGIQIIAVRVTKPTVPDAIAKTFKERQIQRTKLLIKKEQTKLKQKQAEIQKRVSKIQAQTEKIIAKIDNKIDLAKKEASKTIELIENQIVVLRSAAFAKAKKYRQQKLIQLNKIRLIPEKQIQVTLSNLKNAHKTVYEAQIEKYLSSSKKLIDPNSEQRQRKKK